MPQDFAYLEEMHHLGFSVILDGLNSRKIAKKIRNGVFWKPGSGKRRVEENKTALLLGRGGGTGSK